MKTEINEWQWSVLDRLVHGAAHIVAQQWPHCVEADDVHQGVMLRLLESSGYAAKILGMETPAQRRLVRKMGHQVAAQQRDDYERYSGQHLYSAYEVRRLLEAGGLNRERDEFSAASVDLRQAYAMLRESHPAYVSAIEARFVRSDFEGGKWTVTRAVNALTGVMNRLARQKQRHHNEGPGTRKVLSNAQAVAILARSYQHS
ncbi:hypothetical protein GCM10012275_07760 [Longimycelium tulufanense]|uniref:Uncharacterized protein n=1 Tax=Longimycelium tulufanense TaxID=907463 RepID=A0A8J3FU09_9PSEU|nr:hypothetical protein [Longimycelium tulufanense]GGM39297.1 hypothetical protein GCM10012275_07760 [Longimycelium tulufanense]